MSLNCFCDNEMVFHITKLNSTIRYCLASDDYLPKFKGNFTIGMD